MQIALRPALPEDRAFAQALYFETMRWIIERLFGWDEARERLNFAAFYDLGGVEIITADGAEVGWMQVQPAEGAIFLGSLYVKPEMQRRGIGTEVLRGLLARARRESKAVTLAVVKINPAVGLYERHGFRRTHEDTYKVYLRAESGPA